MWEITVTAGRRIGEVPHMHWDCLGHDGGLPAFWMTRPRSATTTPRFVSPSGCTTLSPGGNKTLDRFFAQHGHRSVGGERPRLARVPTSHRNHDSTVALTYQWFHGRIRDWITEVGLGHCVPHQARHTLATSNRRP